MKVDKVKFAFSSVPVDAVVTSGLSIPIVTNGEDHHFQHVFDIEELKQTIRIEPFAFDFIIAGGCYEAILSTVTKPLSLYVTIIGFGRIGPIVICDSASEMVDKAVKMTRQLTLQYLSSLEG